MKIEGIDFEQYRSGSRQREQLEQLARTGTCEKCSLPNLDFSGLIEPAERDLCDKVSVAAPNLVAATESGDYAAVFNILSTLGPSIDIFFDSVRVNVEDHDLRALRHAFLYEIYCLFAVYADFSHVAPRENPA